MQTSATNQFIGIVTEIRIGAVNAEVHIKLKIKTTLVAAITKESVEKLGIQTGMEIMALIKTSQIILVTNFGGYRFSARNQLQGEVVEITHGETFSEIKMGFGEKEQMTVELNNHQLTELQLQTGKSVTALFKAGAVILGVKS